MFLDTKNKFPKQECFQGQDNLVILADSISQINKWHLMFMVQKAIFSAQNIRPSVCPSVRLYVFPSVRPSICMYTVYRQPLRHLQEDHEVILAYSKIRPSVYIFIVQKTIFQQTIFLLCLSVHPVYPFYIIILFSTLVQDNFEQKQTLTKSLINPFGNNYCYNFRTIKKKQSICPSIIPSSPSVNICIAQKANVSIQNIKKLYFQADYVRKQTWKIIQTFDQK